MALYIAFKVFCMFTRLGITGSAIHALQVLVVLQARAAIESKDHGALADLMDQNFNLRRSASRWDSHGETMGYYAGNHGKWIDSGGYDMVILDRWGLVHPVLKKDIASTCATELTRVNQLTY
jgi:hypothetical protein